MSSRAQESRNHADDLEPPCEGTATGDRVCATLERAGGWTSLCSKLCADLEAPPQGWVVAGAS